MTDGSGTVTYTYDVRSSLTKVTRNSDSFSYIYDLAGNITSRVYPDGTTVAYTYDRDNRTATTTDNTTTATNTWDPASELTQTVLSAGITESRTWDQAGRLATIVATHGATTIDSLAYTYDPAGNPTAIATQTHTDTYTYDTRNRLIGLCNAASCSPDTFSYTYDPVGNIASQRSAGSTTTDTFDAADQLTGVTTGTTSTANAFDLNGRQTASGTTTYQWNLAGQLTSATKLGTTTVYTYDGDGNRLTATTGAQLIRYSWDTNNNLSRLVLERDAANSLVVRYLYGPQLLTMTDTTGTYAYQHDGLGSVIGITDTSGTVQATYSYQPYGGPDTAAGPLAAANPLRFTGQFLDPTTGLYDLRARQLDASTGRFLTTDPLPNSIRRPYLAAYTYADDRPSLYTDPLGLCAGFNDPTTNAINSDLSAYYNSNLAPIHFVSDYTGVSNFTSVDGAKSGVIDKAVSKVPYVGPVYEGIQLHNSLYGAGDEISTASQGYATL